MKEGYMGSLEERRDMERERRRRNEEWKQKQEAKRQQLIMKLTSEFVGKKIVKIDVVEKKLHIEVEDGFKMSVHSVECTPDSDYASTIVNNVSLSTFERLDD